MLLLASMWGASYLFIKVALEDLSPSWIVFLRTALATLVLAPIALRAPGLDELRRCAGAIVFLAALQVAGPFLLISAGEKEISSSLAGILVASAPIFTALLAVWLDREETSRGWSLAGVGIGMVGVGVLLGVDAGGDSGALVGGGMVLLASLGYALGGFFLKRRLSAAPPIGVAAATMLASALLVLPAAVVEAPGSAPAWRPLAAVAALGVLGTGISFAIFYTLIADVGPARASLVAYIAPGFAVVYGVVLLGEAVTVATFAGLAMILGGSWLAAEGRPRAPAAPPEAPAAAAAGAEAPPTAPPGERPSPA